MRGSPLLIRERKALSKHLRSGFGNMLLSLALWTMRGHLSIKLLRIAARLPTGIQQAGLPKRLHENLPTPYIHDKYGNDGYKQVLLIQPLGFQPIYRGYIF
jgi:hypothetical protein